MDINTTARVGSHLVAAFEGFVDEGNNERTNPPVVQDSPNSAIAESDSHVIDTPNENLLPNTSQTSSASTLNEVCKSNQNIRESFMEAKESRLLPPHQSRVQHLKPWSLEALACFGVFMSLTAIIITLDKSKNKPLPQLPFSVSINTVVSFESTVFKGCLTFVIATIISQSQWLWFAKSRCLYDVVRYDAAARGPWGSLLWIWEHHIRSPLTLLGAIVMFLTILVDPFVQQLISYVDCRTEMKTPLIDATIPRTNFFAPPLYHLDMGAVDVKIPTLVQNALFAGVEGTPTSIRFDCFTGNCTFSESYSTLGYCHYCEDTSGEVQFNETCFDPGSCQGQGLNITSYLPDGFSITSSMYDAFAENRYTTAKTPIMAMQPTEPFVEFLVAKTVRSGCGPSPGNKTWTCQGYGAAKCMLGPCVRTYNAFITNNEISEALIDKSDPRLLWGSSIDSTGLPGDSQYVSGLVDLHCVSQVDKQKLSAQNYTFNSTTRWLPYSLTYYANDNGTQSPPFPGSMLANGCVYLFQSLFLMSMWDVFFQDFYSGSLLGTVQLTDQLVNVDGPRLLEITYDTANGSFATINSTFASMATYLTNYIRENGHPLASRPAQGKVLHYATCVQVNWVWLAFPSALAGGALVLFIWIVSIVTKGGVPLWKSSPLAFIFRGPSGGDLHDDTGQLGGSTSKIHPDTLKQLETVSRRTVVKLGRSNEVLRLEDNTIDCLNTTRMRRTRFQWIRRWTGGRAN